MLYVGNQSLWTPPAQILIFWTLGRPLQRSLTQTQTSENMKKCKPPMISAALFQNTLVPEPPKAHLEVDVCKSNMKIQKLYHEKKKYIYIYISTSTLKRLHFEAFQGHQTMLFSCKKNKQKKHPALVVQPLTKIPLQRRKTESTSPPAWKAWSAKPIDTICRAPLFDGKMKPVGAKEFVEKQWL